jgi:hypothetical protein
MKTFITCCFVMLLLHTCFSQDSVALKKATLAIELMDVSLQKHTGYVHGLTDSGLIISSIPVQVAPNASVQTGEQWFPVSQINQVVIRRKGAAVHGLLIGAAAGVVLGGITGAITYKDPGPNAFLDFGRGFDMAIGAGAGALLGGLTGVLAAPLKKKSWAIQASAANYRSFYNYLINRLTRRVS